MKDNIFFVKDARLGFLQVFSSRFFIPLLLFLFFFPYPLDHLSLSFPLYGIFCPQIMQSDQNSL